ncbi:MAG TPA: DUF1559 domain-containing protein, partial [Planctomycetaceae bacterium]|nr:DUF1559 domain-containing protein [Planctomycetaceae bacterium]
MTAPANPDESIPAVPNSPMQGNQWKLTTAELLTALGIIAALLALILPAIQSPRGPSHRNECQNNLKIIALALHNYA